MFTSQRQCPGCPMRYRPLPCPASLRPQPRAGLCRSLPSTAHERVLASHFSLWQSVRAPSGACIVSVRPLPTQTGRHLALALVAGMANTWSGTVSPFPWAGPTRPPGWTWVFHMFTWMIHSSGAENTLHSPQWETRKRFCLSSTIALEFRFTFFSQAVRFVGTNGMSLKLTGDPLWKKRGGHYHTV